MSDSISATRCLILDIAMPGMSGPELQHELTLRGHAIAIIFITARADEAVRRQLIARGAVECLFKPFSEQELKAALDAALRREPGEVMEMNAATAFAPPRRSSSMSSAKPIEKPIVFVVDDDISVRESLEALIAEAGWRPEVFASAEEFLVRPREPVPSCLVLDVGLPDLNGLELQKRIAGRPDLPIIFITGRGDIPMTRSGHEGGRRRVPAQAFRSGGAVERDPGCDRAQPGVARQRSRPAHAA